MAQRIVEQVGDRAAQQRLVGLHHCRTVHRQRDLAVGGHGLEVLGHLVQFLARVQRADAQRHLRMVGARQEQHVLDHARQALVLFQVGFEQRLILGHAAALRQRDLGLAD